MATCISGSDPTCQPDRTVRSENSHSDDDEIDLLKKEPLLLEENGFRLLEMGWDQVFDTRRGNKWHHQSKVWL